MRCKVWFVCIAIFICLGVPSPSISAPQDDFVSTKTAFIPIHFSDLNPTIPIGKVYDSYKNDKNPESLAGYLTSLGIKRYLLDFGSYNPKEWLNIRKKRMDYWVERKKYDWDILTEQFIRDSVKVAVENGLKLDEYDKDGNKIPDRLMIFVSSSTQTEVPWSEYETPFGPYVYILDELSDKFLLDPVCWQAHNLRSYTYELDLYPLDIGYKTPVGVWDLTASSAELNCAGLNSFSLWKLGLLDITEISKPGTYEIDDLYGYGGKRAYKIRMPGASDEWLILENRQKTGLDSLFEGLPSSGMVIYHYDNNTKYDMNFNLTYSAKSHYGLKVINNFKDVDWFNKKAVWSQDSGNTEMSWKNSPDNFPLFVKDYTGLHIAIKNISKSGHKMTFELAYENSSPDYITDVVQLDFGSVRKGLKKTLPCGFFFNGNKEIVCEFTSPQQWISVDQRTMLLAKGTLDVTIDTFDLETGAVEGELLCKGVVFVKAIPVKATVTHPIGDVNADNYVDIDDFEAFKKAYPSKRGEEGFVEMADFDGNGSVDIEDFFLMSRFWEK